jgi:hypothetical protein
MFNFFVKICCTISIRKRTLFNNMFSSLNNCDTLNAVSFMAYHPFLYDSKGKMGSHMVRQVHNLHAQTPSENIANAFSLEYHNNPVSL